MKPGQRAFTAKQRDLYRLPYAKVQNAEGKLYTDHKIGNPFDNFAQTCANCHTCDKAALQKWSRNVSSRLTT
ncbi:hypothetical protein DMI62_03620 [Escherichia coli]|nr:hypothetical protein [Escherichia coli]